MRAVMGVPSLALRGGKARLPRKPRMEETPTRRPTWRGEGPSRQLTRDSVTPAALQKLMVMLSNPRTWEGGGKMFPFLSHCSMYWLTVM